MQSESIEFSFKLEEVEIAATARWNRLSHELERDGILLDGQEHSWRSIRTGPWLLARLRRVLCAAASGEFSGAAPSTQTVASVDRFLDVIQGAVDQREISEEQVDYAMTFTEPLLRTILRSVLEPQSPKRERLTSAGLGQLLGIERGCNEARARLVSEAGAGGQQAELQVERDRALNAAIDIVHTERIRVSHRVLTPSTYTARHRLRALSVVALALVERWARSIEEALRSARPAELGSPQLFEEFYFEPLRSLAACSSRRPVIESLSASITERLKQQQGGVFALFESPGWGKSHAIRHAIAPFMREVRAVDLAGVRKVALVPRLLGLEDYELETTPADLTAETLALALKLERPKLRVLILQHPDLASRPVADFAAGAAAAFARRGGIALIENLRGLEGSESWVRYALPPISEPEVTSWIRELVAPLEPSASLLAGVDLVGGGPLAIHALCQRWREGNGKLTDDDLSAAIEEIGSRRTEWAKDIRSLLDEALGGQRAEALLCIVLLAPKLPLDGIHWMTTDLAYRLVQLGLASRIGGRVLASTELRAVAIRELRSVGHAQVERLRTLIKEPLAREASALKDGVAADRIDLQSALALTEEARRVDSKDEQDLIMAIVRGVAGPELLKLLAGIEQGAMVPLWPVSDVLEDSLVDRLGDLLRFEHAHTRRSLLWVLGAASSPPPVTVRNRHRLMIHAISALASLRYEADVLSELAWIQEWATSSPGLQSGFSLELRYWNAAIDQVRDPGSVVRRVEPLKVGLMAVAHGLGARWARRVRIELSKVRIEDWRHDEVRSMLLVLAEGEPTHEIAYVLSCIAVRAGDILRDRIRWACARLEGRATDPAVSEHLRAVDWRYENPKAEQFESRLKRSEGESLAFLGTLLNTDLRSDSGQTRFRWRVAARCRRCLDTLMEATVEDVEVGTRCMDLLSDTLCDEVGGLALRERIDEAHWSHVDGRQVGRAVLEHDALLKAIGRCESDLAAAHLLAHWSKGRLRAAAILGRVQVGSDCFLAVDGGASGSLVRHSLRLLRSGVVKSSPIAPICRAYLERYLWENEMVLEELRSQPIGAAERLTPYQFAESLILHILPSALLPDVLRAAVRPEWDPREIGRVAKERLSGSIRAVTFADPFEGDMLDFAWQSIDDTVDWNFFLQKVGVQFGAVNQFWDSVVQLVREGKPPEISTVFGRRGLSAVKAPRLVATVAMYGAGKEGLRLETRRQLADVAVSASILAMQLGGTGLRQRLESPSMRWLVARAVICALVAREDRVVAGSVQSPFHGKNGAPKSWPQVARDWSQPTGTGLTAFDRHMKAVRQHFQALGVIPL